MKSLKKLLAVLIVVTLMAGMIAVPVFAASFNYEEEASVLNQLDLFKGKSATEYVPALEDRLLREEAVALLLRMFSLEEEAEAMTDKEANDLLAKFKDADQIAAWARKYVAYAVKNEIVVGRPDGNFAPQDNLIGREYSKMLLAMLGYVQGVDFEYEFSTSEFADVAGFPKSEAVKLDEDPLIRDDVVGMSFFALQAEYFAGPNAGKTVIEVIVGDDEDMKAIAIAAGLMEEAVVVEVAALDDIVIKVGEELKLPATVKATLSDGKEADVAVTWPAIDTSKAMEKTEFEGTIADTDVVAKINVTIEVDALLVANVYADNLVEVNVEYNQDVSDNAAVANKDNYSLSSGKIRSISIDGATAVLRLEAAVGNQTPAKLTVNEKILEEKETFEFNYFDRTLPKVLGLEATGPKEFTATFSEPIANRGKVTIKSGSSTLSVNYSPDAMKVGEAKVVIPLYSTLVDGKEYVITIQEFKDFANYDNEIITITYNYVKDTTAPVAEIDAATQEYVVVKFNKPVSGIMKEQFSHTFSAWTASKVTSDADGKTEVVAADSYSKVYVWFYTGDKDIDKPIPEGDISFRILGKVTVSDTAYEIKDLWSNKFETATFTLSIAADKTAPEVKEIKVTAEDAISIEFTKKVSFGKDNIEVLDSDGKAISGLTLTFDPTTDATKFTVKFSKNFAGKTIIINIKNVYDATLNSNKLDLYSLTLDITDKTAPKVDKVRWDGADALYVFFNEDMDEETALNASNYFLYNVNEDPAYIKLSKTPVFFEGSKIVKFNVKDEKESIAAGTTVLFITGVKDVAGNEIKSGTTVAIQKIVDNKAQMDTVNATGLNVLEVLFDARLGLVDKGAFTINGYTIASMEEQLHEGNTKLILTLDEDMPYNPSGIQVQITDDGAKLLKDLFDESVAATTENVIDKIAPAIDGDPVQDIKNNESQIKLTFKENIKTSNEDYTASDFVITAGNATLVAGNDYTADISDDVITIKLKGKYVAYRGKLTIKTAETTNYVSDIAGNKMAAFSKDVTMVDRSYGVDQDGGTGGTGLNYNFDKGVLNITMEDEGDPVEFVENPNGVKAYWLGVKIEAPEAVGTIDENYNIEVTIDNAETAETTTRDFDSGFYFYPHAGKTIKEAAAEGKEKVEGTTTIKIKWNDKYTETITIKYNVDVKVYTSKD